MSDDDAAHTGAPVPSRPSAMRGGSRPWILIAACVFVASIVITALAAWLLGLL